MKVNEYQKKAMTTCMESSNNVAYMLFNLLGEVGELLRKVNDYVENDENCAILHYLSKYGECAKDIRKNPRKKICKRTVAVYDAFKEDFAKDKDLQKELGDVMWQLNGLMSVLGLNAEDIAQQNLDKLADRKKRDQIDGDGDNR